MWEDEVEGKHTAKEIARREERRKREEAEKEARRKREAAKDGK